MVVSSPKTGFKAGAGPADLFQGSYLWVSPSATIICVAAVSSQYFEKKSEAVASCDTSSNSYSREIKEFRLAGLANISTRLPDLLTYIVPLIIQDLYC